MPNMASIGGGNPFWCHVKVTKPCCCSETIRDNSCWLCLCIWRSLLLSYQKKDWRGWRARPRQSFFWYDINYRFVISSLRILCCILVGEIPKENDWWGPARQSFWYDNGHRNLKTYFCGTELITDNLCWLCLLGRSYNTSLKIKHRNVI